MASRGPWTTTGRQSGRPDGGLISGNGWVDLQRPGVDAAGEVLHVLESLLQEELGRVHAAHSHVAVQDDLGVRVELLAFGAQRAERDELSARDLADVVFPRFPDIDQDDFFSAIEFFFQLLDRDGETHGANPPVYQG